MKTKITGIILILLTITGLSCQTANAPLAEAEEELVGPTWQLVAFIEGDGGRTDISYNSISSRAREGIYTAVFTEQGSTCSPRAEPCGDWYLKVIGYPNEGWLSYNLDLEEKSIEIYVHAITKVLAPEDSKESEFFEAFRSATRYQINGKQLSIFYGDERALLFEPVEAEEE